jgi:hypothetical protein
LSTSNLDALWQSLISENAALTEYGNGEVAITLWAIKEVLISKWHSERGRKKYVAADNENCYWGKDLLFRWNVLNEPVRLRSAENP